MKVIIAGGRYFNDYDLLRSSCDKILRFNNYIEIISGTAKGTDQLGEKYAQEKGYTVHRFPANWDKYGKKAGILRNEAMAKNADALIAFWDGKTKGTKNIIDLSKKYGLKVNIIFY